jgi:uncharacterized membrane protein YccC
MSAAGNHHSSAAHDKSIFQLQQAFKLALSMVLFYWLALWMNWDEPKYGGLAIVIISLGTTGASIEKGLMRVVGTTFGVAVGFLILSLFNHDRWATMLAFAVYLTAMCYFMQTSRYPYAWYAAAFIPLVIWGDNYPNFEKAFYFGTFRYLNTTVGVLIYTMVDLVFWPRQAGDQLNALGRNLWDEAQEQFRNYRGALEKGQLPEGACDLRAKLAGTLSRTMATLQQAYLDTPAVSNQKRLWESWRLNARGLVDAMEIWQETIDDCRELDLDRLLPELGTALDTLDKRLERIGALWEKEQAAGDDGPLTETLALDLNRRACADLSHLDRAALMSFVGQLKILDRASRELLRTMRVLAGIEPRRKLRVSTRGRDVFQPSWWDPGRLIHALYPPAVFIAGFLFWVFVNPPTGPKVPMFAGILALVLLRTPMNPVTLLTLFLLSIFLVVAPVYWLVMPTLSTGFGLLSLIFIFSFVFGYLGGRSPALKSGPLIMFVVATGISNQQNYSFQGLVDAALMILLAGVILTVVHYLFNAMHPAQNLLRSLRRFFHGCARVTRGFALVGPADRNEPHRASGRFVREPWASAKRLILTGSERAPGRRLRKRYLESMVMPAPAEIQSAQQHLDYKLYPDNTSDNVQRLHDSVQSIAYRLVSLEMAHDRLAHHSADYPESFVRARGQVCDTLQHVFERWASLEPGDAFEEQRGTLQQLSSDLRQQLDALGTSQDRESVSDGLLADLYAMLGCVRGLVEAMADAQGAINQINWPQWAAARF